MKEKYIDYVIIVFLVIISSIIMFNNIGASTVYDWDEARNAENALEILKTNDWIVLKYGGKPDMWNLKPPLGAWLIAISFKIFGVNEFALRFFSALFGIGTIILVYLFGKEIKNRYIGGYAAIILLTVKGFIGPHLNYVINWFHGARTGEYDVLLTFLITLSLYFFYLSQKREKNLFLIWSAAAIALGVLVKGIIGLFPIVIIILYLLYFRLFKKMFFTKETKYAVISFFIIIMPWFVLRFIRGRNFFIEMLKYDLLKRFSEPIEGHVGNWLYYFFALLNGLEGILFLLFIISFVYSLYLFKKKDKIISFLMIWILFFIIIFTIAKTKILWYILPIYPAVSLLIAYNFDSLQKLIKIKKIYFVLIFLLIMIIPFLSIIKSTQTVYINPKAQLVKDFGQEIKEFDVLYIHSDFNSQSVFFYLNVYVNEKVNVYQDIDDINIKKDDGVMIFDLERFSLLENKDYELIKKAGNTALFQKI